MKSGVGEQSDGDLDLVRSCVVLGLHREMGGSIIDNMAAAGLNMALKRNSMSQLSNK